MMLRIPLFDPDRVLTKLESILGFLVSPVGMLIWLVVVVSGFFQLLMRWNDFFSQPR